jgi:hypothetical protein
MKCWSLSLSQEEQKYPSRLLFYFQFCHKSKIHIGWIYSSNCFFFSVPLLKTNVKRKISKPFHFFLVSTDNYTSHLYCFIFLSYNIIFHAELIVTNHITFLSQIGSQQLYITFPTSLFTFLLRRKGIDGEIIWEGQLYIK